MQGGGGWCRRLCLRLQSIEMEGRGKGDAHVPLTKVAFDTVFSNVLCTVASCGCSRSLLLLAGEGAAAAVVTRDLLQQVYCELVNFS